MKVYTSRFAAKRAMKRMPDAEAMTVTCHGTKDYRIVPSVAAVKAIAKVAALPAPNATRAAELKRAAAEGKAKKKAKAAKADKPLGARAQVIADAQAGKLPPVPDFTAETHRRFRPKLDELVKLVKAGDVKGLKAFAINPISTSPKAMDRYRNLSVIALQARP